MVFFLIIEVTQKEIKPFFKIHDKLYMFYLCHGCKAAMLV